LLGFDSVDGGEGEADEAVRGGVFGEGLGDCGGEADGLSGDGGTADVDGVDSYWAAGEGAVAVGDVEG
jgi:hypothetical protein